MTLKCLLLMLGQNQKQPLNDFILKYFEQLLHWIYKITNALRRLLLTTPCRIKVSRAKTAKSQVNLSNGFSTGSIIPSCWFWANDTTYSLTIALSYCKNCYVPRPCGFMDLKKSFWKLPLSLMYTRLRKLVGQVEFWSVLLIGC